VLIINADDWGRDETTTDRILECVQQGTVSSSSSMMFMGDSERAAALALEHRIDVGLHLNLTTAFSAPNVGGLLEGHWQRVSAFLRRSRLAQVFCHPGLASSFEYLVKAQLEEFHRLHGFEAQRIDGHHHMHLCANVLRGKLLPAGTIVRKNFSFRSGEKSWFNRQYRARLDRRIKERHRTTDFFFNLAPIEPERLRRIFEVACHSVVEVETHPVNPEEYEYLQGRDIFDHIGGLNIVSGFSLPQIDGKNEAA
jgi:predicted glycoside hydrolase/deacetylase ChbG (UPF0249 family)